MPPGQPANPSKIPSDYYCRTQAVYQMDLALLRVRFDNAVFCSGQRGSRVIWVLKMEQLRDEFLPRERRKKLTNSLISHPNCCESEWLEQFLQGNKIVLDMTQIYLSTSSFTRARPSLMLNILHCQSFFKQLNPRRFHRSCSVYRSQLLCARWLLYSSTDAE